MGTTSGNGHRFASGIWGILSPWKKHYRFSKAFGGQSLSGQLSQSHSSSNVCTLPFPHPVWTTARDSFQRMALEVDPITVLWKWTQINKKLELNKINDSIVLKGIHDWSNSISSCWMQIWNCWKVEEEELVGRNEIQARFQGDGADALTVSCLRLFVPRFSVTFMVQLPVVLEATTTV